MQFPVPEEGRAAAYGFVLPDSSRMRSGSTITREPNHCELAVPEKRANVSIRFEAQS